ncbi:ABC transporter permease [Actinomadura alba]|uniref:ABC transporter permease n=1 Tax=Actinomadura alba TaxID=406431 RepID=A0ABR7LLU5_9ACTN|nr:ABC transporter permease [Actinomadura alba]MBC6465799.1 ABC transporter permease [Actinomadura alba]
MAAALESERKRTRRLTRRYALLALATPTVLLLVWQALGSLGITDTRIFPPPSDIARYAVDMTASGQLPEAVGITVARLMVGYVAGAIVGIAMGLVMGVWKPLQAAFDPLFSALYALPKISILPILLLIFGFTETPRVLLVMIGVFFILQINTLAGIRQIDPRVLEAATAYGATGWRLFRYVVLPAVLPSVFTGLRVSAGMAVTIITSVEFVAADNGVGFLIWNSWQIFQPGPMYVGMASVALLGAILTALVLGLERILIPWRSVSGRRFTLRRRPRPAA